MPAAAAVLPLEWPTDLAFTVAGHGWVQLAPFRWDGRTLARQERIAGRTGEIAIRQSGFSAIEVVSDGFDAADSSELFARVQRWLSADWDPAGAIAALPHERPLFECGGGRLLRGSSFFEDFVKTVLTINTNWAATCRMASALVAEPGGGAFPEPQQLLDYGEGRLRAQAKLGFRAPTLVAATRRMLAEGAIDEAGRETPLLDHKYLIGLNGIGPYAAAHCCVLLHDFARIPVDSSVISYLRERHGANPAEFAASRASWGDYLALGYRLARLREKLDSAAIPAAEVA